MFRWENIRWGTSIRVARETSPAANLIPSTTVFTLKKCLLAYKKKTKSIEKFGHTWNSVFFKNNTLWLIKLTAITQPAILLYIYKENFLMYYDRFNQAFAFVVLIPENKIWDKDSRERMIVSAKKKKLLVCAHNLKVIAQNDKWNEKGW